MRKIPVPNSILRAIRFWPYTRITYNSMAAPVMPGTRLNYISAPRAVRLMIRKGL